MEYSFFTQLLLDNGISRQILELLVAITLLATLVSIARYIFGSKTYGIYAPIILAISYSYSGLRYGLVVTATVIITTLISYSIIKKIRMHYITRIAINYCLLSITLVLLFLVVDRYGLGLENMSNIAPLAVISIAALSDFFIKQYVRKSLQTTALILGSTILIAVIGWYLITRQNVSDFMINNLWIIPSLIFVNLLVGQFKGLRIKDFLRFNSILSEKENVSK
ncbi:MAG: 7TM domain-containing protein [Candidatus Dojkabacteria bacterium]